MILHFNKWPLAHCYILVFSTSVSDYQINWSLLPFHYCTFSNTQTLLNHRFHVLPLSIILGTSHKTEVCFNGFKWSCLWVAIGRIWSFLDVSVLHSLLVVSVKKNDWQQPKMQSVIFWTLEFACYIKVQWGDCPLWQHFLSHFSSCTQTQGTITSLKNAPPSPSRILVPRSRKFRSVASL